MQTTAWVIRVLALVMMRAVLVTAAIANFHLVCTSGDWINEQLSGSSEPLLLRLGQSAHHALYNTPTTL